MPTADRWIPPGMHHVWSIEDAELFTLMVPGWVDDGTVPAAG
ncbi:hypothetical protein [Cryobacterium fucosi]|nr:hypothetical protein [Cryobacterium fucosi]